MILAGKKYIEKVNNYMLEQYDNFFTSQLENLLNKANLKSENNCPGYVTVGNYQRNGHEVSGYTRSCPYHNR